MQQPESLFYNYLKDITGEKKEKRENFEGNFKDVAKHILHMANGSSGTDDPPPSLNLFGFKTQKLNLL